MSPTPFFIWSATVTLGLLGMIWRVSGVLNIIVKAWLVTLAITGIIVITKL